PPNWIICGSFWNCGAPPDNEIAVAIVTADRTVVVNVAANAAAQSVKSGVPFGIAIEWNTTSAAVAPRPKLTRLKTNLMGGCRNQASAAAEPTRTASR